MSSSSTTRQRLVEAAAQRFWRSGFHGTSLAEVLQHAEAHGGSLYHFFRSKEELLLAVLDRHEEGLEGMIFAPALTRSEHPVERVFCVLGVYRDFLEATGCGMGCPIGNLALETSDTHPRVRDRVGRIFDRWSGRILELLEEARELFPPDVDLDGLSRFVLTVMEGGVMQAKAQRSLDPFDDSVAHLRRYFQTLLGREIAKPGSAGRSPRKGS